MLPSSSLNVECLVAGLVAGVLAIVLTPAKRGRALYPVLSAAFVVLLLPHLDMTIAIAVTSVVVGVAAGWAARDLARSAPAPVLATAAVVALVGAWAAVPDTEAVLAALGVVLVAAAVAVRYRPPVGRMLGWPLLGLALAVAVGASCADRLPVAVGGLGCLLALPAVAIADRLDEQVRRALDLTWPPHGAALVVLAPLGAALLCARVATRASTGSGAALVVAAVWVLGVVALVLAVRAVRPPPPPP